MKKKLQEARDAVKKLEKRMAKGAKKDDKKGARKSAERKRKQRGEKKRRGLARDHDPVGVVVAGAHPQGDERRGRVHQLRLHGGRPAQPKGSLVWWRWKWL